jgi:hypothetical protein
VLTGHVVQASALESDRKPELEREPPLMPMTQPAWLLRSCLPVSVPFEELAVGDRDDRGSGWVAHDGVTIEASTFLG